MSQIGTLRTSAMQRVRFEHEFQAALLDADSASCDVCEFVSFRTIVRELTRRTRMRRVLSIQLFSLPARKLRQSAHHYHPGLGDAAAESVNARAPCRNGLCRRTHCFKGVNYRGHMSCRLTGMSDAPTTGRSVSSPWQLWPRDRGNAIVRSNLPSRL